MERPRGEFNQSVETEKQPTYRIMITRHAERLPSGELSPEGIEHAQEKGKQLREAEVYKGYASDHPSGRAVDTAENIGLEAGILSPDTGKRYATRKVKHIQYDLLDPSVLKKAKTIIEEATLSQIESQHPDLAGLIHDIVKKDGNMMSRINSKGEPMVDIEKLPKDIQRQIAPIRQGNQKIGFRNVLQNPEPTHKLAIGLGHQIFHRQEVLARYSNVRDNKDKKPEKDVVLNIVTHGLFMESLLKEAGIMISKDGEEINGITDFESEDFGGYIDPAESICLNISDPNNIPERIPVEFEGKNRPNGKVFIDRDKLMALEKEYIDTLNGRNENL